MGPVNPKLLHNGSCKLLDSDQLKSIMIEYRCPIQKYGISQFIRSNQKTYCRTRILHAYEEI